MFNEKLMNFKCWWFAFAPTLKNTGLVDKRRKYSKKQRPHTTDKTVVNNTAKYGNAYSS